MQVLVAFFVAALINVLVLLALRRRYESDLFRIVSLAYVGTVTLRYALAIYLWLNHLDSNFSQTFWGDSQTYDFLGAAVAENWSHGASANLWANRGRSCQQRLHLFRRVHLLRFWAKRAPDAVHQRSHWLSDDILCVFRLRRRLSLSWIAVYLLTAGALVWLRFYIFYVVLAAMVAGFFVGHRRGAALGLVTQLLLVTGVLGLLLFDARRTGGLVAESILGSRYAPKFPNRSGG